MTYANLKADMEKEILFLLANKIKSKKISISRASEIAKLFVSATAKTSNSVELINCVSLFCRAYPEIIDGFLNSTRKHEDELAKSRLDEINLILKGGGI